jgi:uncharacterized protein (DUF2141 family)
LAVAATQQLATAAELAVTVENVKGSEGVLMVGLYASEADYRKTAARQLKAAPGTGRVAIRFADIPAGDYAVALYHDRNGNGKLDSNLVGIPTEPYGFSGSRVAIGAPGWREARVRVAPEGAAISVHLSD